MVEQADFDGQVHASRIERLGTEQRKYRRASDQWRAPPNVHHDPFGLSVGGTDGGRDPFPFALGPIRSDCSKVLWAAGRAKLLGNQEAHGRCHGQASTLGAEERNEDLGTVFVGQIDGRRPLEFDERVGSGAIPSKHSLRRAGELFIHEGRPRRNRAMVVYWICLVPP